MEAIRIIKFKNYEIKRNLIENLPYNPKLKEFAKNLRKSRNLAEVLFWNEVKSKKFHSLDFDRQRVIDNYIVDFYCAQAGLVLEIDGGQHYEEENLISDKVRSLVLRQYGLVVLRFTNLEIKQNFSGVCEAIELLLKERIEKKEPNPSAAEAAPPFNKGGSFSGVTGNRKGE